MDAVLYIPSAATTQARRLMNSYLSNAEQYAMNFSASALERLEPASILCLFLAHLTIHQAMSSVAALKQRRYRYCWLQLGTKCWRLQRSHHLLRWLAHRLPHCWLRLSFSFSCDLSSSFCRSSMRLIFARNCCGSTTVGSLKLGLDLKAWEDPLIHRQLNTSLYCEARLAAQLCSQRLEKWELHLCFYVP